MRHQQLWGGPFEVLPSMPHVPDRNITPIAIIRGGGASSQLLDFVQINEPGLIKIRWLSISGLLTALKNQFANYCLPGLYRAPLPHARRPLQPAHLE